jgi:hypothetical protein
LSLLLQIRDVVDKSGARVRFSDTLRLSQSDNIGSGFFDDRVTVQFQRSNDRGFPATRCTSQDISFHTSLVLKCGGSLPMFKPLAALFAFQILALATQQNALAGPTTGAIVSPDRALRAVVIPVDREKGFEANESRVEIRKSDGKLICSKDYSSSDGEHGYGVQEGEWTPDSQFFVYDTASSGGHQPYRAPTFFYSRQDNRVRNIEELTNRAVLDQGAEPTFKIVAPHSVAIASSPNEYSPGRGFDTDHSIIVTVNLQTGKISPPSKWPAKALP